MNHLGSTLDDKINKVKVSGFSFYSENLVLKPSSYSRAKSIGKDIYREKDPLKLRHWGVKYVTIDKLLSKVM